MSSEYIPKLKACAEIFEWGNLVIFFEKNKRFYKYPCETPTLSGNYFDPWLSIRYNNVLETTIDLIWKNEPLMADYIKRFAHMLSFALIAIALLTRYFVASIKFWAFLEHSFYWFITYVFFLKNIFLFPNASFFFTDFRYFLILLVTFKTFS